ncbi:MAG: hypothetical protein O2901_16100, partial [Verrucomicrobia bacterium]|nr:hypothetical protein [Verrucomicrobiota bacterium]
MSVIRAIRVPAEASAARRLGGSSQQSLSIRASPIHSMSIQFHRQSPVSIKPDGLFALSLTAGL